MLARLAAHGERWPLARPFRIARGMRTAAECIVVEIEADGVTGRGEGLPYARYGETVDDALARIRSVAEAVEREPDRQALRGLMPAGAARNALDAALWDLEAKRRGVGVQALVGAAAAPGPLPTALTVSLDDPSNMGEAASRLSDAPLLKIKVDERNPEAAVRAVREAAPDSRLIVDPNESWTAELLARLMPAMAELKVDLIEQPVPAGEDEALERLKPLVPLCADESAHVSADVETVARRYQAVNIKLDKTGGLTEALEMKTAARSCGLMVMVGCMISTSLSMGPAIHLAQDADFVDLDGPWWLAFDRLDGVSFESGRIHPAARGWGSAL